MESFRDLTNNPCSSMLCRTPSADKSFLNKSGVLKPLVSKSLQSSNKKLRLTPSRNASITGTGNKTPGGDRFIPNRSANQYEISHYMMTNQSIDSSTMSPQKLEFQRAMSENLNKGITGPDGSQNTRILSYQKTQAPLPPVVGAGYVNGNQVLYNSRSSSTCKKVQRHIPPQSERILDAPALMDDYYLNVLDWSTRNHVAVGLSNQLYLWDAATSDVNVLVEMPENDYIAALSFLDDGNFLAVGTSQGDIQIWDVDAKRKLRTMTGHADRVGCLSWNTHILSSGSRSGAIFNHDVRVAQHLIASATGGHTQEVCGLKWSPDRRYLASGGNDNVAYVWPAEGLQAPILSLTEHQAAVKGLSWCPWQPGVLATGSGTADRHIRFWNTNRGVCMSSTDTQSQVCSLLWSTHYKELLSAHGFPSYQLSIWKYPTMTKVADLNGHTGRILYTAMSPCGEFVASAAADESIRIWNCFGVDPTLVKKKTVSKPTSSKKFHGIR